MKLKRHLNITSVFIALYFIAFSIYIIIGLQPAEAIKSYDISGKLSIPSINLDADVTTLTLNEHRLDTPETIVGSYSKAQNKTLLIGHSTTVFADLERLKLNETINYNGSTYRITNIDMVPKSTINMDQLLSAADKDTIIIMTCAGQLYENSDSSHRLLISAVNY